VKTSSLLACAVAIVACGGTVTTNDAGPDAGSDVAIVKDAVADVQQAAPTEIYLVATDLAPLSSATSIEVIDITMGKEVRRQPLSDIVGMTFAAGSLYVARGGGQHCVSVVDPATLAVTSTITLPWDPVDAVFSADASMMYAMRGAGYVDAVSLPSAAVVGEVQVPLCPTVTGSVQPIHIALDHAGTLLGLTIFSGNEGCVATVSVSSSALSIANNVPAGPISGCPGRMPTALAFSLDDARLATFDPGCATLDVYHSTDLSRDDAASAAYPRPNGASARANVVYDNKANAWAANFGTVYEVPTSGSPTSFTGGATFEHMLSDVVTGTVLVIPAPANNGIFQLTTSGATKLSWDLSLMPANVGVSHALYVSR
jgi:YVTN family beta-propeller protein